MRTSLEPAFVLHTKPFRDTSLFVDLFSLHYGRIRVVAKGARRIKSSLHELLTYFTPLLVSWSGKTDLPTLSKIDRAGMSYNLTGENLLQGMYVNELIWRLLEEHVSYVNVYTAYSQVLAALANNTQVEGQLRLFEKLLLAEAGYGITFDKDLDGNIIAMDDYYSFVPSMGFKKLECNYAVDSNRFLGKYLLDLHENYLMNDEAKLVAKNLLQLVLQPLVNKKLKSFEILA